MRIETHVHTKYSNDSIQCFWLLYLKCKIKKIDVIAITEHNNVDGGLAFQKFCQKRCGKLQVIVGEEIFTDSGEIIGLFLKQNVMPGQTVENTIIEIKRQGGLVYVPHPYDLKRNKTVLKEKYIAEFKDSIDCIEIHNGRNISQEYDAMQKKISEKYGISAVIGSDAHTTLEVGRNYMECEYHRKILNSNDFKKCISNFEFHSCECLRSAHKITAIVKLLKLIEKGDFYEIYRVVIKRIKNQFTDSFCWMSCDHGIYSASCRR